MKKIKSYAAVNSSSPLEPYDIERRECNAEDVLIKIEYCGVCHSDIHMARNEWGGSSIYPLVPGHEIIGVVEQVGNKVTNFSKGDNVGVGVYVDSCGECNNCKTNLDHYCEKGIVLTYNSYEYGTKTITYGGYSKAIVVNQDYVVKIPKGIDKVKSSPLLCAVITTYSPLKYFKIGSNHKVGIPGLGGLAHMGLKLALSFGANVTVYSTSESKRKKALS